MYIVIFRQQKETVYHTRCSLNIGDIKTHPHSDILPPIRPHLLIAALPMGKHLNTCVCGSQTYSNYHIRFTSEMFFDVNGSL